MTGAGYRNCLCAVLLVFLHFCCIGIFAQEIPPGDSQGPLLLRDPALSAVHVAFTYAGDIWIASRDGSNLRRLTKTGHAAKPVFSPDGSRIAFMGLDAGIRSAYVVSAAGGEPRRLTFHPADFGEVRMSRTGDMVGWTPDSQRVVFSSRRAAYSRGVVQLFTVPAGGGAVEAIPLVRAVAASFSPDARRIAYVPNIQWQPAWKRYRGGQTTAIWIANAADSSIEARIPRENSNDFNPMWVGEHIYFLSDRNGPVTLFSYDVSSGEVRQLVKNADFDLKSAAASSDAIVYEQFGSLHLLDLESGRDRTLDIRPVADFPQLRPEVRNVAEVIESSDRTINPRISASGDHVAFGLRGDILIAGGEQNEVRNATRTPGAVERDPGWSPNGRAVAYFSDESGEYALHIRSLDDTDEVRRISLGEPASFHYSPLWSPDSRKIGYTDKKLNYWYVDLESRTPVLVDTDLYVNATHERQLAWSPDSRWLAYTKQLVSHLHAVFIYSLEHGKSYQLTDGMSDALYVAFDRAGQYLYFTASTDASIKTGGLNVPSILRPVSRNVYALSLKETLPLLKDAGSAADGERRPGTTGASGVDFGDVARHILSLPIPARHYDGLLPGGPGSIFLTERIGINSALVFARAAPALNVYQFDVAASKTELLLEEVAAFDLSFDREKMLYARQNEAKQISWYTSPVGKPNRPSRDPRRSRELNLDAMQIFVDPRIEWRQMFEQVWRNQRDFFYDPGLHGVDPRALLKKYEPFLENLSSRDDLDYLFTEMLGNVPVDHMAVAGPQTAASRTRRSTVGLLGADIGVKGSRYCFERIFERDTWDPQSRSPLNEPSGHVEVGEYLLAVDGQEALPTADVYKYLEGTAGNPVVLKVGPRADGRGSREIEVVPLDDEGPLRNFTWMENNRRVVDELTNGRVAYVYLPDVDALGYRNFNRYFFSQAGRDAVIVDERFNAGGILADYFIDYLRRPLLNYFHMRDGRDYSTPMEGIFGPKVLITNEIAGSGGDHLAWLFRRAGLGPLVGKRTWGGLIGGATNPNDLLDGGAVSTPNLAFYSPDGTWDVENHSVPPDYEVEESPYAARMGRDLQLEKAVEVVLELLDGRALTEPQHPPYRRH